MPNSQFPLPGFDEPTSPPRRSEAPSPPLRRAPYRLFFAIFPGPDEAWQLAQHGATVIRADGLRGKAFPAHRLHVTLHDLGGYHVVPHGMVVAANAAGDAVAKPGFEIVFDRAASFAGGAFVLYGSNGVEQLATFRQDLGVAMMNAGLRPTSSLTPHMTLLHDQQRIAEHPVEPVRWNAREFALVKSHVGKGIHEILGRWTLAD